MAYIGKARTRVISRWASVLCLMLVAGNASALEPSFAVSADSGAGHPVIHGQTNLPDGTKLLVTLVKQGGGYAAQAKATVKAGRFLTDAFSDGDQPVPPGQYTITIDTGPPGAEPPAVRAAMGDHGQNLTGPLVIALFGNIMAIEFTTTLRLGGA
jgi:hypothetical protein